MSPHPVCILKGRLFVELRDQGKARELNSYHLDVSKNETPGAWPGLSALGVVPVTRGLCCYEILARLENPTLASDRRLVSGAAGGSQLGLHTAHCTLQTANGPQQAQMGILLGSSAATVEVIVINLLNLALMPLYFWPRIHV
ncbi:hypothetical protein BX600DRAFT_444098 [Xylariales sp. PMI_506]|nr:hypothetical protein BX600DRAFT_444098 [Xylariales sp. PMI_506]